MNFPDMTINGIVVKQEIQISALRLFLQNTGRRAKDLEIFLEDLGVPVYTGFDVGSVLVSKKAAGNLLQRAKKYGIVLFSGGRWLDSRATEAFLKGSRT